MSLRINDVAPNFTAHTTRGIIDFHACIGDQWTILFSHPKDFTPVCITELGCMARIEPAEQSFPGFKTIEPLPAYHPAAGSNPRTAAREVCRAIFS